MQVDYSDNFKIMQVLGAIVKKHRKEKKYSINKLAAELEMSSSTLFYLENGKFKDIYFTNLWKIAEGLDIPLEAIIRELKQELGEDFSLSGLK